MSEKDKDKKGLFGRAIDAISSRDEKEALEKAQQELEEAKKTAQQAQSRERVATAQAKIAAQKDVEEAEKRAEEAEKKLKEMEAELTRRKQQDVLTEKETRAMGDFDRKDFAQHRVVKSLAEHTVGEGETLSHIAQKYYGHSTRDYWMVIYEANKAVIGDNPGMIKIGAELKIPELPANLKD